MRLYMRENREPYTIGVVYKGKGEYLGKSKGVHKFKRHEKPFFQKATFGPRYHFEKVD